MGDGRGDASMASISGADLKEIAEGKGGGIGAGSETSRSVASAGEGGREKAEVAPRKVATGAVKREMRKREEASSSLRRKASRGSMRRNRRDETEDDASDGTEGSEDGEESVSPVPFDRASLRYCMLTVILSYHLQCRTHQLLLVRPLAAPAISNPPDPPPNPPPLSLVSLPPHINLPNQKKRLITTTYIYPARPFRMERSLISCLGAFVVPVSALAHS